MFLKCSIRRKDGKEHRSWSIVERRRVARGGTAQRHLLYLGEINDSQHAAWQKCIEVFAEDEQQPQQVALFPSDRVGASTQVPQIQLKLSEWTLRPRHIGGGSLFAPLMFEIAKTYACTTRGIKISYPCEQPSACSLNSPSPEQLSLFAST